MYVICVLFAPMYTCVYIEHILDLALPLEIKRAFHQLMLVHELRDNQVYALTSQLNSCTVQYVGLFLKMTVKIQLQ